MATRSKSPVERSACLRSSAPAFDVIMKTVISTKGQLVLPAELRQRDGVVPGQEFDIERLGTGVCRLARRGEPDNGGLVDLLLSCPEKDWFVPIVSESTATLGNPGFGGQ